MNTTLDINAIHADCLAKRDRQLFVLLMLEAWTATAKLRAHWCARPYRITRTGDQWRLEYWLGRRRVVQSTGDTSVIYDVARRSKLCWAIRQADELWSAGATRATGAQ